MYGYNENQGRERGEGRRLCISLSVMAPGMTQVTQQFSLEPSTCWQKVHDQIQGYDHQQRLQIYHYNQLLAIHRVCLSHNMLVPLGLCFCPTPQSIGPIL